MKYKVFVDITVSKILYGIEAETDEQAQAIALEKVKNEPYYYAAHADGFVKAEVEDFDEDEEPEEDSFPELTEALDYVREQLGASVVAVIKAQVDVCYEQRRSLETDYDDEVHDLLEEWGEEHGHLSEEWWSESIEFQDIIAKI